MLYYFFFLIFSNRLLQGLPEPEIPDRLEQLTFRFITEGAQGGGDLLTDNRGYIYSMKVITSDELLFVSYEHWIHIA